MQSTEQTQSLYNFPAAAPQGEPAAQALPAPAKRGPGRPRIKVGTKPTQRLTPMKTWMAEEALRQKVSVACIRGRLYRGGYDYLTYRRVNKRVVYVVEG